MVRRLTSVTLARDSGQRACVRGLAAFAAALALIVLYSFVIAVPTPRNSAPTSTQIYRKPSLRPTEFRLAALNAHCCGFTHRGIDCGDWRETGENCTAQRLAHLFSRSTSHDRGAVPPFPECDGLGPIGADVVCLNEVPGEPFVLEMANLMGFEFWAVSKSTSGGHPNKYKAILSRFPLSNVREYDAPKVAKRWRPATILAADVDFALPIVSAHDSNEALQRERLACTVYSLHVPNGDGNDWAPFLLETLQDPGSSGCVILSGDFNNVLKDMSALVPKIVKSTWPATRIDLRGNSKSRDFTSNNERQVIDHILFEARHPVTLAARRGGICEIAEASRPSDHKPIWADFELARQS